VSAEPSAVEPSPAGSARDTVRVLFDRNMFPYLAGNAMSGIGSWFQLLGMSILIFRLTGSTFLLGVLGFAQLAAVFVLAPWSGSVADRHDRRRVLALSEASGAVVLTVLTVIAALGEASTAVLILFALLLGVRTAFSSPAQMTLVPSLVQPRHLSTALALNSVTFNVGRSIGPVLAAAVIAWLGTTWSFGFAAALAFAPALSVLLVRPLMPQVEPATQPRLRESLGLVRRDSRLAALLFVTAAVAVCTDPAVTLGPAFMSRELHHHDSLAGLLVGALGIGAIIAAFTVSHRLRGTRMGTAGTLTLAALGAIAYALAPNLGLAMAFLVVLGFGYLSTNVGATSRILAGVATEQQGRIMALWTICFLGVRPIGSLIDGSIASVAGVRVASAVMAVPAVIAVVAILVGRMQSAREARLDSV
jgi:MFS family permease